jgi:hypothetical protein
MNSMHGYLIYGAIEAIQRTIDAAGPGERTTRTNRRRTRTFQRGD